MAWALPSRGDRPHRGKGIPDVSGGALIAHRQETVTGIPMLAIGTQMMKTPADPLAQPELKLILSYWPRPKNAGPHPARPGTANAVAHPTNGGTGGSDHRR